MKRRDNLTDRQTDRQTNYVIDCFRILAVLMVLTVHVRGYLEGIPMIISKLIQLELMELLYILSSSFANGW